MRGIQQTGRTGLLILYVDQGVGKKRRILLAEITDTAFSEAQIIALRFLNGLGSGFSTDLTSFNLTSFKYHAIRDNEFHKLDNLRKSLEDKEARMKQESTGNIQFLFKE